MTSIIRGSTAFFSAACLDQNGSPVTPISANLYLNYKTVAGTTLTQTIAMAVAANIVSAQWDSSVAADCLLQWSIKAIGSNKIVQDGELNLTANAANSTT